MIDYIVIIYVKYFEIEQVVKIEILFKNVSFLALAAISFSRA